MLLEKLSSQTAYRRVVLVAAGLALGLYAYVTSPGLAGTGDTYTYLYAAQTLRQSGQLLMPDGSPFQAWPPLFAATLALIGAPGPVRWLNGLALVSTLVAWSVVGRQLLPAHRAWLLPLLLVLSVPALLVSKFIWSESVFNGLWAGYFMALVAWLRRGRWQWGAVAAGLGCLLPLQRLAGLFLMAGVGVGLAWPGAARRVRPGRWALLGHLAATGSGLLAWQWHRWPASAPTNLAHARPGELARCWQSLADSGFVLGRWLLPLPMASFGLLPVGAWVGGLALLLLVLWPRHGWAKNERRLLAAEPVVYGRMLLIGLLATVVLVAVATALDRCPGGQQDIERYLSALYPAVLLLMLLAWPAGPRWAGRLGPVLLACWLLYQGVRLGHVARQLHQLPPANTDVQLRLPVPASAR